MTDYERFNSNNEYARAIGLCPPCEHDVRYFCTPVGSMPIGTLGADGVSFCFIEGFGETVFCISPSGTAEHYVFPVACNFAEFLSLAATLGNMGAAEQIMCFGRERFYGFFPTDRALFDDRATILAEFELCRIDDPWSFVRGLSNRFSYELVKFTDEYYDILGFPNPRGKSREAQRTADFHDTFTFEN